MSWPLAVDDLKAALDHVLAMPWRMYVNGEPATHAYARARDACCEFVAAPFGLTSKKPRRGYVLVPCDGEAHRNAYIDHCMSCAPRWGYCEVKRSAL